MDNNSVIAEKLISLCKTFGADDADVMITESRETSYSQRLGKVEGIERSESKDIGLRVFINDSKGCKVAVTSTNNILESNLKEIAETTTQTAKVANVDEHLRLAEKGEFSSEIPKIELFCDTELTPEKLTELASQAEDSALEVKGITNSEGAEASYSKGEISIYSSKGFEGMFKTSGYSVSVSVIASNEDGMETDYDYSFKRFFEDLDPPAKIGRNAGELASQKLSPRKISSCKAPIIFDPRVSKSILGTLCSAINGSAVVKESTFLLDMLGQQIFPENINIFDDPNINRGIASEPFDAEGLKADKINLIENGVLKSWILDIRTASKLGLKSNGRAARSVCSNPHPSASNVYMNKGEKSPQELIKEINKGLYLTDAFGMGINTVTGTYSQGASGFWIENGEIQYPVSEITVAGNLLEMFKNIEAANDLEMKYSKNAPTLRIDGMTIAGA